MDDKEFELKWEGVKAVAKWLSVLEAEGQEIPKSAIAFEVDTNHSSLLRRIMNEDKVFPVPPPLAFSRPNYSLIENGQYNPYGVNESGKVLAIDSHPWKIVEKIDHETWITKYRIRKPKGDVWSKTLWRVCKDDDKWLVKLEKE